MTRRPLLALAGLWLAICVAAAAWVTVDRRPPEWDHANHLERAVDCYRNLRIVTDSGAREILEASSFYPPLATCAAGALYLVFPIAPLTAQVVMMAFLALALACVYGLGRRLADVETGLWAAFLLATAPFVVFSLTNFQLDLPLAAMVALTLYAVIRAEDFGRPGWSLALGAALALPWYGPRLFGLPAQMLNRSFKQAAEQQNPDPLTAAALSFYPRTLPTQLGLVAAFLLLWGLWTLGKEGRTARGFLWLATLGPFVLFSLIQNKNLRYTLPILPAAVLVAAMGLRALPSAWRRAAGAGALAAGVLQVSMTLWALPPPPTLPGMILPLAIGRPPSGADWQHDRILADLGRASRGHAVTVAIVPNDNFFSVSNFRYEVVRRGLPFRMTRSWTDAPLGV